MTRTEPKRTVLISGAGVAGLALACRLDRREFDITLVEKASAPRHGGYPIDVRGTALEVAQRIGILPRLRDAHIDLRRLTFLDEHGDEIAALHPHALTGGANQDLEMRRGDLTTALHAAARDDVEFRFHDSINTLHQHHHGVDVTFRGGDSRTFDLVIGADGLHSRTRELVFGPERPFHRYLGHCFAGFTLPNTFGLARETVLWNSPGRAAALYAAGDDTVHALLDFTHPGPPSAAFRTPEAQHHLVTTAFADAGWEIPRLLAAMRDADDLFFDAVGQIRMPRWTSGRVALAGDAAHAPSFRTGQGTSLALVGAYVLADHLTGQDHTAAYAAYERTTRDFVTANQDQLGDGALFPTTAHALHQRNAKLRELRTAPAPAARPAHSALTLPPLRT
ncbi:FAD-dependent monooxygenase [Saccharopolyspora sp. NPDC002578]